MLIFLYGPDSYRRTKKLKELENKYKKKYGERADVFEKDIEDEPESWREVSDFLSQPSMFVRSKLAIIKNPTSVDKKEWIKTLKNHRSGESVFIILSDNAKKPKKSFSFLLKKPVSSQKFNQLEKKELSEFIKKEGEKRGVSLEKEAFSLFVSHLKTKKSRSAFIVNELEKISLSGTQSPVRIKDLADLMSWTVKEKVFVTARRILQTKNGEGKLIVLDQLLSEEDPAHMFNLVASQTNGGPAKTLAELDVGIKSGKLNYENALLASCFYK